MSAGILKLDHAPFVSMGSALEHIMELLSSGAELKAMETRKYILGNIYTTNLMGVTPEEYRGLSILDWKERCGLRDSYIKESNELDNQVYQQGVEVYHQQDFLAKSGFVRVDYDIKKPVFSSIQSNKIVAIFIHSKDITTCIDLLDLFSLYEHYYPHPREAIRQFLRYLKIDTYFNKMPARREVLTLLALRENDSAKYGAKLLEVGSRTIDEYKARLKDKLKIISLDELVIRLRKCHEHPYELSDSFNVEQ